VDIPNTEIEYGRFHDLERLFGIKRSTAYALISAGKIRSVAVKKKGARFGIRLIDFASVRSLLGSETPESRPDAPALTKSQHEKSGGR
jgi:hypothetical protein